MAFVAIFSTAAVRCCGAPWSSLRWDAPWSPTSPQEETHISTLSNRKTAEKVEFDHPTGRFFILAEGFVGISFSYFAKPTVVPRVKFI